MSALLRMLGTGFLAGALVLVVYIGVAVVNQDETANTLVELVPSLAFHAGAALVGIVCFGLAHRLEDKGPEPGAQQD